MVDSLFNNFGGKVEQGDGSVVLELVGIGNGFLRSGFISACFHSSGKVAEVMDELKMSMKLLLMVLLSRLNMCCGKGPIGAPERTWYMRSVVLCVVSWSQAGIRWLEIAIASF